MKKPIEYIRSKKRELFLQKKWWHRLAKVSIWIGVIYFVITEYEFNVAPYCMAGIDCSEALLVYFILWIIGFCLIQIIYYKIVIYVIFGKDLPK
jgi:hypothetical protein